MQLRSPSRARALRAAALAPLAAIALGGQATPAAAAPVSLDLNYTCTFPLLKPQPLQLHITSDIPSELPIGKPTGQIAISAKATVNAGAAFGLRSVDATTVEGSAVAVTDVIQPTGATLVAKVPTTIPQVALPTTGGFDTTATGATPSLTFTKAGNVLLNVRDLILTLTPRLADGTPTGLDTFETECSQDAGQPNTLATIKIVDPSTGPTTTNWSLTGQTYFKTLAQGTVPVTGTASLTRDAATGALDGAVALDPARGNLKALNLLPVKASFVFTGVDRATGSLASSTLTLTTKQNIRLTNVSVFGINLVTGTCQTTSPASITLKSTAGAFPIETGGSTLSTFTIPPIGSCGALGSIVSGLTAGAGNAMSLKFTPKPTA